MRRRYPYTLNWTGDSNATAVAFWSCVLLRDLVARNLSKDSHHIIRRWPQFADELLEDMGLPSGRSCGKNWLTWPFQVVDIGEVANLKEERDAKRRM